MQMSTERRMADDGTAIVALLGDIDFTNADEVSETIEAVVTQWSPRTVRVDLRDATFIDSTGLGALIAGYRAAIEAQVGFVVVNPSATFRRVLTVTGLCDLFKLPDPESAADSRRTSDVAI